MTKNVLKMGLFSLITLGIFSCKNKENELAEKRISALETYVDSLKMVSSAELENNWDKIAMDFDQKNMEANEALSTVDEDTKNASQVRLETSAAKYKDIKSTNQTKVVVNETTNGPVKSQSTLLRDRLFGAGKIGNDMSFSWVNKNNILSVYDKFYEAYKENKSDFSREDYDEIKLMYEALDSRKNTVEKEGLSASDNGKIASIKFKLSPMFKVNRIGAKSRENQEAKE
jgi:hypothetical protein